MKAKISIGSSAFAIGAYERDPIPFDTVIRRLAELHFDGVELFGARPYGHPDDFPSQESRRELRRKLSDPGLEISNYGADLWAVPLATSDRAAQHYEELFKRNLEFCADIGCDSIRVDTVSEPPLQDGVSYGDALRRVVTTWRNCSRQAQEAGISIYWEFEPGFIFNKPSEVVHIVDEIGSPNFKVMFDTCHAQMCAVEGARQTKPVETLRNLEEFIRILGKRIGTVHLIDSDKTLHHEKTSTHAPFGQGVLDFDSIMIALIETGYSGPWWTIDPCFWPTAWDLVGESKRFVTDLLERHGLR
jgi:sugar phosphate isomerase/epimerase